MFMITHQKDRLHPRAFTIGQTVSNMDFLNCIEALRKRRFNEKTFFYDVIGMFRTTAFDVRTKVVQMIRDEKSINSKVGLVNYTTGSLRKPAPKELLVPRLTFYAHIEEMMKARMSLCLPGVTANWSEKQQGAWTWRHVETLALGIPMITATYDCFLPCEVKNPPWIVVKSDYSDLIKIIKDYLNSPAEWIALQEAGAAYFDKYLSPKSQAKQVLGKVIDYLA
jgi:glycosyltransferase involved in cell wall biosynthesis